jgi:predicted DNA-binding transcriptional regulator AlpA
MTKKATYSINEVAAMTGWSRQTVTRLFERERGVLILERPQDFRTGKRKYRSIRIPRAVYERVVSRIAVK